MLAQEGKLDLNASVRKYVAGLPENWERITIAHLLSHTSGLPELFPEEGRWPPLLDNTTADRFSSLIKLPLVDAPGTRGQYSDPGYFLLGVVIEKVSGQRWGEFLSERMFKPLEMKSTSVIDHWTIVRKRVSPYTMRAGQLLNARRDYQDELPSFYGLRSTVEDLAKWDQALGNETLLKMDILAKMCRPAELSDGHQSSVFGRPYGFGWMLGDIEGHPIAEHGGFTGTHILRVLDNGTTVIVLTNLDVRSGSQPAVLARGVLSRLTL
jgi:D-alanyl-D-alanine carboxypeptidase